MPRDSRLRSAAFGAGRRRAAAGPAGRGSSAAADADGDKYRVV